MQQGPRGLALKSAEEVEKWEGGVQFKSSVQTGPGTMGGTMKKKRDLIVFLTTRYYFEGIVPGSRGVPGNIQLVPPWFFGSATEVATFELYGYLLEGSGRPLEDCEKQRLGTTKRTMAADGQRMERELEDPAECWIDLVTACNEPDHVVRRQRVEALLQKARESQWTMQLWLELTDDAEYGGSVSEEEDVDITGDTDDDHFGSSDEEGANDLATLKS